MIAKSLLTIETIVIIAILIFIFEKLRSLRNEVIGFVLYGVMALGIAVIILAVTWRFASARDYGQWENADPAIRHWYKTLMQPDNPSVSCCGEADAYWADEVHVRNGKTIAVITDDRDDAPLGRPHIDVGTEIEIPPQKLKWDRSNPTGHNVLFVSRGLYAWCFVQGSGI